MDRKVFEIAAEIVKAQVTLTPMSGAEIAASLREVFNTLQAMQKSENTGVVCEPEVTPDEKPVLTPENSIQNDKVICLECGAEMRQLTKLHLGKHGMDSREYKQKYGFGMKTPLSAKSLTRARIKIARKRGIPEKLKQYLEAKRQSKAAAALPEPEKPKRVIRRRKAKQ